MPDAKSVESLEAYLQQVRDNLSGLPPSDISEILKELRSHVLDRVGDDFSMASMERALSLLGDPKEIARANRTMRLAARGAAQNSPRVVAHTFVQLARVSATALVTLLISLAGYAFAAVWLIVAIAKPFWPDRVGLWSLPDPTGDLSLSLGRHGAGAAGRDLLGWWIIPIGLLVSLGVAFVTFCFHQGVLRHLARPQREDREKSDL